MVATAFSLLVPMETEEAQIARGLRQRDPDLLDALIAQYQHRLLRYLLHLTGNRAVAEDLFQETWLRVLEKGHLYDGRNRFVTWLMSIAHNVAIDHLRKRSLSSLDEMKDPEDGAPFEPPATGPSPFDQAVDQQQQARFQAALAQVAPIFREVLVLRFQEQMKLEEIAQLIRIPVSTVKTRIYRGVQALRPAAKGRRAMTDREHERAIDLITLRGVEGISGPDANLAGFASGGVQRMRRLRGGLREYRRIAARSRHHRQPGAGGSDAIAAAGARPLHGRAALADRPDRSFVLHRSVVVHAVGLAVVEVWWLGGSAPGMVACHCRAGHIRRLAGACRHRCRGYAGLVASGD